MHVAPGVSNDVLGLGSGLLWDIGLTALWTAVPVPNIHLILGPSASIPWPLCTPLRHPTGAMPPLWGTPGQREARCEAAPGSPQHLVLLRLRSSVCGTDVGLLTILAND